jgi:outer membrane receptor protein involved in Fe transport
MKKRGFFLIGMCFISLIFFRAALADETPKTEAQKDYQVFDLGEIFVTSQKPPAVQEMAITNVLTPEDFKATNSTTVAEALTYVPGIRVDTGRKNQALASIHGLDQTHILILIDGVPYYETKYGFLDLNEIPVDNIARIEVTKGDASVLYGPNAFAGVINIITKKATEKLSIDANFEYGPYNYNRESVSTGMKVGMFSYWLSYTHQQEDAWSLSNAFVPQIGTVTTTIPHVSSTSIPAILQDTGRRYNSDYRTDALWAKVGIDPNPGSEYYLNFHYITREKGDPPDIYGGTTFPTPSGGLFSTIYDTIPRYDDWGIDLSGQQKIFDQLTLKGKLFYHNHVDDYASYSDPNYANELALSRYEDYNLGGSLLADVRPLEWDIVRLAFNYVGNSHKETIATYLPFAQTYSETGSLAVENEFNLIKHLSVVVGTSYDWFIVTKARQDNFDNNGNYIGQGPATVKLGKNTVLAALPEFHNFEPMIGANYNLTDTTRLFGSIAQKVRYPTLNELYTSKGGNPDLKPEKTVNYTLGVSQSLSKYVKVELAGFYHDISNFISNSANPIQNPFAQYQNYARIQLLGFEVNAEISPMKDLILKAGYMFNDARDRSIGAVTSDVINIPEHKIDLGVRYTIPYVTIPYIKSAVHLDLEGLYMARIFSQLPTPSFPTQPTEFVPGYFTANARLSTTFLKHFEAYIAVNNLFDKNYQSDYGFPGPGRFVYAGISAKY